MNFGLFIGGVTLGITINEYMCYAKINNKDIFSLETLSEYSPVFKNIYKKINS